MKEEFPLLPHDELTEETNKILEKIFYWLVIYDQEHYINLVRLLRKDDKSVQAWIKEQDRVFLTVRKYMKNRLLVDFGKTRLKDLKNYFMDNSEDATKNYTKKLASEYWDSNPLRNANVIYNTGETIDQLHSKMRELFFFLFYKRNSIPPEVENQLNDIRLDIFDPIYRKLYIYLEGEANPGKEIVIAGFTKKKAKPKPEAKITSTPKPNGGKGNITKN